MRGEGVNVKGCVRCGPPQSIYDVEGEAGECTRVYEKESVCVDNSEKQRSDRGG